MNYQTAEARNALYLFVAGSNQKNRDVEQIIAEVCHEQFGSDHELTVINVQEMPALAKKWQIVAVPTLLAIRPGPGRRIVGDLTDRQNLVARLDASSSSGDETCRTGLSATMPAPVAGNAQASVNRSPRSREGAVSPQPRPARPFPTAS